MSKKTINLHSISCQFIWIIGLSILIGLSSTKGISQPDGSEQTFARFPDVSPDGKKIAFSFQGDIWTVPASGGTARRLTVHEAYESHPRWSPDGEEIAFVSDRYGNRDLFVMNANGDTPRRLTHHSTNDGLGSWTTDGRLLFTTSRMFSKVEWDKEFHTVASSGSTPERFFSSFGRMPQMAPDGSKVVFVQGYNRASKVGYRGPANKDLWLYDIEQDTYKELTRHDGNDMYPRFSDASNVYYLSEKNDVYNLYTSSLQNEDSFEDNARRVTGFKDDGIRYFDVSDDGSVIVAERKTGLYRIDASTGKADPIDIEVTRDNRFYETERNTKRNDADEYAVSPNEKWLGYVVRGELFITPNEKDQDRSRRLTNHSFRDRDIGFLNNETILFSSDRDGNYNLYALVSADPDQSNLFLSLKHKVIQLTDTPADERRPVISPDKEKVAFTRGRGKLVVASLQGVSEGTPGIQQETVLLDGWATPDDVSWSPDSRWLAYSKNDLDFNEEIYIHKADDTREPVNISKHPRPDTNPVWSKDGSKLAFLSSRNNGDRDIWFAWLKEEDWEKTNLDWEMEPYRSEKEDEQNADNNDEDEEEDEEEDKEEEPIEIDFDQIYQRLEQVTSLPGNEAHMTVSEDGETFYFVNNLGSWSANYNAERDLHKVKWDGTELQALTEGGQSPSNVRFGPKGTNLYMMLNGGSISRYSTDSSTMESLPFKANLTINHNEEKKQIFQEAWRTLDAGFYDPDFHGENWDSLRQKYRPWAMKASTKSDFQDIFNFMLGELNASHMGLYSSDRAETQNQRTGLLGIEIVPVEKGARITHVVPGSPADRQMSTLHTGEIITEVEGTPVNAVANYYSLLTATVNEEIRLLVEDQDGNEREVVIQPTGNLNNELYQEWVDQRRELTEKYSDGKIGYIHIEGMNWPSFERFERELVAAGENKDALIIDVRYNGGGWTTDYLLTVLNVRQHAYTIPRGAAENIDGEKDKFRNHYPYGERLPFAQWTKPVATICNNVSYSNAEIFSHAFKNLDIGPLIGEPTFGAVISTGGKRLIDGSYVRLPYRGWFVKKTNKNMEHNPAIPDYLLKNPPDYRVDNQDRQLQKAVEVLEEQLSE